MKSKIEELEKKLISVKKNIPERVDLLNNLGWELWVLDPPRAVKLSRESLELAKNIGYEKGIAYAQLYLSFMQYSRENVEKAMEYVLDSLHWFQNNGDKSGEALSYLGFGFLYWGLSDFERGFDTVFQARKLYEELNDANGLAWTMVALGGFYQDWKDYQQALQHFQNALELFKSVHSLSGEARAIIGIGNAFNSLGENEQAIMYLNNSLKIYQSLNNKFGESRALNDIGLIYQDMDNLEKALEFHQKSLALREELNYPQGLSTSLMDIGNIYYKQKDYEQALILLQKSLALSVKIKAKLKIGRIHELLSKIYKARGDYENALQHFEKYYEIDEEVFHEDTDKKLRNIKAAYEVEASKREAEIFKLRNVELKEKNEQLQKTLNQLNITQAQLLQAGKMAALGNLVAGILHEMNTPVGTIKSALDVGNKAITRLTNTIRTNDQLKNLPSFEESQKLLDVVATSSLNSNEAIDRILKIVNSLKNFAQMDSANFKKGDLHEGIESVLTLLEHELGERIRVEKNYGKVPQMYLYQSELNQVFMNILLNSINAIENEGVITIKTHQINEEAIVEFSDNGKGIPKDKIDQLFEPGFNADNTRVKMRSGLFASYNIIRKHRGEIRVDSEVGKGSSFVISLPMNLETDVSGIQQK
jgi:signal transduction histidine kinase